MAGTDHLLLSGSVVHVQLAASLSKGLGGSALLGQQSIMGVSQPLCAGRAREMGSSSLGEWSWNYLPVPWDWQVGKGCCQERPLEKHVEETPAGAGVWIETELKSLMLQVLWLQTDEVLLCARVSLATIGGLRCIRFVTGNVLHTPCKTGKGQGWAVSVVMGSGGWEGKRCNMLYLICGLYAGHTGVLAQCGGQHCRAW